MKGFFNDTRIKKVTNHLVCVISQVTDLSGAGLELSIRVSLWTGRRNEISGEKIKSKYMEVWKGQDFLQDFAGHFLWPKMTAFLKTCSNICSIPCVALL